MRTQSRLGTLARFALSGLALAGAAALAPAGSSRPFQFERSVLQVPESPPEPRAAGDIVVREFSSSRECPPGAAEESARREAIRVRLRRLTGGLIYALLVDNPATGDSTPEIFHRGVARRGGLFTCSLDTRRCMQNTLGQGLPFGQTLDGLAGRNFEVRTYFGIYQSGDEIPEGSAVGDPILGEVVLEGDFPGQNNEE